MAQNVTVAGATYSAVPSVNLPKQGGGTASFFDVSDTTATTADVASGAYFYTAAGVRTAGTSSGGGASNYVHGEFTANDTAGVQTVSIPYTGSGYPIMAYIVVKGGAYKTGTDWYNLVQRYAVGMWCMSKSDMGIAPDGTSSSAAANQAVVAVIYKNSTSSANVYMRTSSMTTVAYSTANPSAAALNCVRISATSMKVYVNTSNYGLVPGMDYEFFIVYSS